MDYVKIGGCDLPDGEFLQNISAEFKISKRFAQILWCRGINSRDKVNEFLNCSLSQLHDPFLFNDMQAATERIARAKQDKESVVVFGDYDVDGISATYILLTCLKEMGLNVNAHIPHRIADGYGLTESAIKEVKDKFDCTLIITVDCGISCRNEIAFAKTLGIEVIVTDHHIVPQDVPNALIINPKMQNDNYPYENLCGAGVAFKVVQALAGLNYAKKFLSIAAIATVADIVSLTGENRAIVKLGLEGAKRNLPIGLKKLCEISGVKKLTAQAISFRLAPKINAPGRLGNSSVVLELFLEKDEQKAGELACRIFDLNSKRQDIGANIYEDCLDQISKINITKHKCLVLKNENWEAGLLGIACAKLSGEFNRPTFLFALHDGVLKGSVRSIDGINIVNVLTHAKDYVLNFGGHEMAAGVSISESKFDAFKECVERYINTMFLDRCYKNTMEYDIELSCNELNLNFAKELEMLEPTGCDNSAPVFKMTFDTVSYCPSKNCRDHLILTCNANKFLCFNGLKFVNVLQIPVLKVALAEVAVDEYKGRQSVKIVIKYIKADGVANEGDGRIYQGLRSYHTFNSYGNIGKISEYETPKIKEFGNVYISFDKENAQHFATQNNLKLEAFSSQDYNSESLVLLAPLSENEVKNYQNIWMIDEVVPMEFAHKIACLTGTQVHIKKMRQSFVPAPNTSREIFAKIFTLIKMHANYISTNIVDFYVNSQMEQHNIMFEDFAFCLAVFRELEIIKTEVQNYYFKICINKGVKKDLLQSKLYGRFFNDKNN